MSRVAFRGVFASLADSGAVETEYGGFLIRDAAALWGRRPRNGWTAPFPEADPPEVRGEGLVTALYAGNAAFANNFGASDVNGSFVRIAAVRPSQ